LSNSLFTISVELLLIGAKSNLP